MRARLPRNKVRSQPEDGVSDDFAPVRPVDCICANSIGGTQGAHACASAAGRQPVRAAGPPARP